MRVPGWWVGHKSVRADRFWYPASRLATSGSSPAGGAHSWASLATIGSVSPAAGPACAAGPALTARSSMARPISAMRCAAVEHIIESYLELLSAAAESTGFGSLADRSVRGILAAAKQQVSSLRLTSDVRSRVWITLAALRGFPSGSLSSTHTSRTSFAHV